MKLLVILFVLKLRIVIIFSDDTSDSILWMVIDGKGLEILTYIVILVLYTKLKCHLKTKVHLTL